MDVNIKQENLDFFFEAASSLNSPEEAFGFFSDLCSRSELKAMSGRLAVARLLSAGKVYKDVEEETQASSATISRVSRAMTYGTGELEKVLKKAAKLR